MEKILFLLEAFLPQNLLQAHRKLWINFYQLPHQVTRCANLYHTQHCIM